MKKLNIIYIEDSQEDADLAGFLLSEKLNQPFVIKRVETKKDFFNTANEFYPDIILSDVNLPGYSGNEALQDAAHAFPEIPFIMVTGTMSEEVAADFIKAGAWDYVIKERLIRLVRAVESSLELKDERDKKAMIQEKLVVSKERLALAMQGSQDAIWDWDIKTGKQYFSGRWNEIRGYDPSETILNREEWVKLVYHGDLEDISIELEKHLSGETEYFQKEFRVLMKDNRYKWIMARGKAMFNKEGKPYRMSGSYTDISERKETEERLRTFSKAIINAPVSVMITDKSGDIQYVNPKFSEITGYKKAEVIGKNPRILKSGKQSDDFYAKLWNVLLAKGVWKGTFINKKKNGEMYWESASIASMKGENGGISHFIAIKEDISGQVESEIVLQQALKKAEESDRLKSSFLANMSHEIRTPMNGIMGFSDLITKPNISEEKKIYYAGIVKSSSSRLLRLLTDIINFSKIDAGEIEILETPFNLNFLIDEIINEAALNFHDSRHTAVKIVAGKGLENDSATFISDELRLKQILMNLVSNALKFTSRGSVEVGYEKPGNEGPVLYVKDTGIGIPEEMMKIIFDRFRQVDETSKRRFEGVGLGLSIAKGLVERFGGKIWLESEMGKGTTFYVKIPMEKYESSWNEKSIVTEGDDIDISDLKILIVEDDLANQKLLREFFEGFERNVRFACNGREAIGIFKPDTDIDLVLMDMKLPDMSGIDVAKQIKKINPQVKVIAQTAFALIQDKERFMKEGCDGYIEKPYDSNKLFREIRSLCKS